MVANSPVKSPVDPTFPGQEDIVPTSVDVPNIKTSKTGGTPEAQALSRAVDESEKSLSGHRGQFRLFTDKFAGNNYGCSGSDYDPMNLIYSLVSTLVPALSVDPKATVETVAGNLAFAETFRLAIDDEAELISLSKTMRAVVTDSLFGIGIIKTGLKAMPGFQDKGDMEVDAGTIFSERVSFINYIIDMASTTRAGAQFEGDRYSITETVARESGMFDEDVLQQLISASDEQRQLAMRGGSYGYASGSDWNQGVGFDDEFERRLFLVDLFLPSQQKVVTIPGDVLMSQYGFLNQIDWTGDPSGPIDTVGFSPVPDRILATPVIGIIYDLYVLLNKLGRKVARQADRQKDIIVGQKGREDDADTVMESIDGKVVMLTDPDSVKPMSFGGANDDGFKTVAWYQDFLNRIAGNPDLIGGLSADANTLGQDQLSLQNANARIDDWRQTALNTSSSVLRKLAGYLWTDKDTSRKLELKIGEFTFPREFGKDREGEFEDYRIGIDAHHRPPMSPDQSYLRKQRWITEILLPLQEAAKAQGMTLDVNKVASITAVDLGIENDAEQMYVPVEDIERLQQQQQQGPPAGQVPERGPRLSQPSQALEGV